jgi:diaminohydroxyphosphoribosylaminopyrimidine deaminase/5-amino-6-(5-phosphoribosylamino)uracil reductase
VAGIGFKILKKAGIEVKTGICKRQGQLLNAPFFKFAKAKRPWVIVKWAQSKDGFLARSDGKRWISSSASRKDAQKLRKRVQAILVGINTVIKDNPKLTVRPDNARQPLRIVLGSASKLPRNCNLLRTTRKSPVYIFNGSNLNNVLARLGKKNVQQLLVEGGEKVITSFLRQKLVDEVIIYTSAEKLSGNGKVKASQIMKKIYNNLKKNYSDRKLFGKDVRLTGFIA